MKRSSSVTPPAAGFRCVRRHFLTLMGVAAVLCLLPRGYGAVLDGTDTSGGNHLDAWDDAVLWDDGRRMPERR